MDIESIRQKIDACDEQIIDCLIKRYAYVEDLGRLKADQKVPVFSPEREEAIMKRLIAMARGKIAPQALRSIYSEILSYGRFKQRPLKVGHTLEAAQAALQCLGASTQYCLLKDAASVCKQVQNRTLDYGVVSSLEAESLDFEGLTLSPFTQSSISSHMASYQVIGRIV